MTADFCTSLELVKAGRSTLVAEVPQMLAFIGTLDDPAALVECQAQASAVAEYLARRKDATDAEFNAALKVKLRVEHRLGEVLKQTVIDTREGGDNTSHPLPPEITRKQSSCAQQLAASPWSDIEKAIDATPGRASRAAVVKACGIAAAKRFMLHDEVDALYRLLLTRYRAWPDDLKCRFIDRLEYVTELLQEEITHGDGRGGWFTQAAPGAANSDQGGEAAPAGAGAAP